MSDPVITFCETFIGPKGRHCYCADIEPEKCSNCLASEALAHYRELLIQAAGWGDTLQWMRDACKKAEAERDRLREALKWYEVRVGALNWYGDPNSAYELDAKNAAIDELEGDRGQIARKALEETDDAKS